MAGPHYLLDTNVLSAVVKRPRGELARRIAIGRRWYGGARKQVPPC